MPATVGRKMIQIKFMSSEAKINYQPSLLTFIVTLKTVRCPGSLFRRVNMFPRSLVRTLVIFLQKPSLIPRAKFYMSLFWQPRFINLSSQKPG